MPSDDRLAPYRAKRSAGRTPEPFGGRAVTGGRLFVVQHHHARNLHWDLRLEMDGVLVSWAVPKGPSPDPADKRLAMHVEDHPLEYGDFEGVIPEGQYGAGPSIVWDRGTWTPRGDPAEGMEKGKLLFDLHGHKLKGLWTLVHTPKAGENHWLFIKERDAQVDERGTDAYPHDSIYSGLEVDELPRADEHRERMAARAAEAGAPEGEVVAGEVEVMKATRRDEPFDDPGWVFEIKYDGYRLVAGRRDGAASLWSRAGNDLTATFPEIARAVRGLPWEGLVVDGEVVVHAASGLPDFGLLQRRGRLEKVPEILRAAVELPATYWAFDLLAVEGRDTRGLPLLRRKELLRELLPSVGPVRFSDHVAERGETVYERTIALGLEGIVAKKADSPYRSGRREEWLKIPALATDDFVVVGWTDPKGSRAGFGALHLAQYVEGRLTYRGSVGTGFGERPIAEISERLAELASPGADPPCAGETPRGKEHHWARPELVAEVRFKQVTDAGMLRQPAFLRLRDDKPPEECTGEAAGAHELPEPPPVVEASPDKTIHFTNLDKVLWPEAGHTKGDLVEYYRAIAPWILPYLRDRPLVLTRFPDGIYGNSFFQKNAPEWAPEWIRTETVWSEGSERDLDYFVAEDVETLLYVANSAAIPLHVWSSRFSSLDRPDWSILDLDPKGAPFEHVVRIARTLKATCDEIGLPAYPKSSGSSGLHVLVPLGARHTWEQSQLLAQLLARVAVTELPEIATVARVVEQRGGRVYVDAHQNGHGKLLVAPFCVRPVPEAAVSVPLRWEEVTEELDIRAHTIETVPGRMEELGEDPLRGVLEEAPDLVAALGRLAGRVG